MVYCFHLIKGDLMKYKVSFYKRIAACAMLFFILFSSHIFSDSCLNFSRETQLYPLLYSMQPAHTIMNTGKEEIVIEKPGSYHLIENITGEIRVKTSNVIINLNGFALTANDDDACGIELEGGLQNIVIKNGTIIGGGGEGCYGIWVDESAFVRLENLTISDFEEGISFYGKSEPNEIECCRVVNCLVKDCKYGFCLSRTNKCIFKDCVACCCFYGGFYLDECKYNKFVQCKAIKIGPSEKDRDAIGFDAHGGVDNLFYECMTENVFKQESDWCTKAMGFRLGYSSSSNNPETESKIVNCCVDSITGAGLGNAFGISLEFKLLGELTPLEEIPQIGEDARIVDVDWSPQGDYVAVALGPDGMAVLKFDRATGKLSPIWFEGADPNLPPTTAVEWSPDGQYLAVGREGEFVRVNEEAYVGVRTGFADWCTEEGPVSITFVSGESKDLSVYKFNGSTLSLVASQALGKQQVWAYSTEATLVWGDEYCAKPGDATCTPQFGQALGITLPGVDEPTNIPIDSRFSNHPTPVKIVNVPDSVLRIVWSRDGRHLFVTTDGTRLMGNNESGGNEEEEVSCEGDTLRYDYSYLDYSSDEKAKLVYLTFDGKSLTTLQSTDLADDNSSKALAITADDKLLAYGVNNHSSNPEVYEIRVGRFVPFFGVTEKKSSLLLSGGEEFVWGADWNPIACCEKYYLAVVESSPDESDGSSGRLVIFEYNAHDNTLNRIHIVSDSSVSNFYDVKWSPRGKELVVTSEVMSSGFDTAVYEFDPTPNSGGLTPTNLTHLTDFDNGPKYVDWSPCSKYLVLAGGVDESEESGANIAVVEVGECIENCVVENNKVANISGGLCGIGIIGAGCCNLIDQNKLSGSCVNASAGVFNTFYSMKTANDFLKARPLDNLAFVNICC